MRIVRYYPRALLGDGGMTNAVRVWSETMARIGAEVAILYDGAKTPPAGGDVQWVSVTHTGPQRYRMPVGLQGFLEGADLMVLHSAWVPHNIAAASAARARKVPYLLEPRGAYDPHIVARHRTLKAAWWRAFEGRLVARCRAVHLFFDSERDHLRALGYSGPAVVAPNGIKPPEGIAWDGGTGGYVLWLGRFDPEHKGLDLLLDALALVPKGSRPLLRLHGPDRRRGKAAVAARAASLGLEPWVSIEEPSYGLEKWQLLSRARGFVYPSRWEGFGNSVAEAVSIGVPTLATTYPLGLFLHSRGGAFLAQPEAASLAEGLEALASPGAAAVGRKGAEIAREISWEAVTRAWMRQVEALL